MPNVAIGRLIIDAPGLGPEQGKRLGEMVASRLASARWQPAGSTPAAQITVAPSGGADLERLAQMIIDEMRRRLS